MELRLKVAKSFLKLLEYEKKHGKKPNFTFNRKEHEIQIKEEK